MHLQYLQAMATAAAALGIILYSLSSILVFLLMSIRNERGNGVNLQTMNLDRKRFPFVPISGVLFGTSGQLLSLIIRWDI